MVKIRLTRGGAKKRPFYHIIVTDVRSARDGRNIERLGYYNPVAQGAEPRIVLDLPRVDHWVSNGAQLTDKVRNLYREATKAGPGHRGLILRAAPGAVLRFLHL
ncbi:30S ribosomal protein S16 [Xanthomonas translucens pv. translucens]|uniref:30S ribosomal protein S16 n=1 Tax=Xanthomonas campestris pv. translucens TaxID=343 RepID=UPI0028891C93|nr:30S ribosomal protein S16 [Xanthomonas translucens]WNJ26671.1 30S ribosomal protein S16 [Xanthomonas translucens pv. translucens]